MSRIALMAALALVAATTQAQDPAKKADPKADAKAAAMMEAMMKHATPGPEHKKLEPIVGLWAHSGKMWMDPSAPPQDFQGTTERKWVLGGRFVYDETKSSFSGMPFEGLGYTGYDNALKKYTGLWIDNMSTSTMTSTGTLDSTGKVLTNHSECYDASAGKVCKSREVMTIVSNDEHRSVMYKIEDGKEIKVMELVFKRKK
jgi:hypothetical protein